MPIRLDEPATSNLVNGCLVVTVPIEIADKLPALQAQVLERVRAGGLRAVVLELSAVQIMDRIEFAGLRDLAKMLRLLGARTVFVGLRPGIVAWMLANDVDVADLEIRRHLEDALRLFAATPRRGGGG